MIRGLIREDKTGRLILNVAGSRGFEPVEVLLDSGFNGEFSIPKSIAVKLGLELIKIRKGRMADGRIVELLVFKGKVLWEGNWISVKMSLTSSKHGLLGTSFLSLLNAKLHFDFESGEFKIET